MTTKKDFKNDEFTPNYKFQKTYETFKEIISYSFLGKEMR